MYTEQMLICADCGAEFPFTVAEQEFYAEKGFTNAPALQTLPISSEIRSPRWWRRWRRWLQFEKRRQQRRFPATADV